MSPTIYREKSYRFFFFSREEPRIHIHIVSGKGEAKFWFESRIEMARNQGYNLLQLHEIATLIEEHNNEFIDAWKHHFYWPDIDVDLTQEIIENPEIFPLKTAVTE